MQKSDSVVNSIIILSFVLLFAAGDAAGDFSLPPPLPPEEYGNILIDRISTANGQKAVSFSHWLHRTRFTCRVCHGELDFLMKVNATEITEQANTNGRFCGACHNGKIAFRHDGNCEKCHNGRIGYSSSKFAALLLKTTIRRSSAGNGVNWTEGLSSGAIKPRTFIRKHAQSMNFEKELLLQAGPSPLPPAIFPHKAHSAWLDCDNCHPELFNIRKTGTRFSMNEILQGDYCGVCHLKVAFPMDECGRCHPAKR